MKRSEIQEKEGLIPWIPLRFIQATLATLAVDKKMKTFSWNHDKNKQL
jgi:hypothetical protein